MTLMRTLWMMQHMKCIRHQKTSQFEFGNGWHFSNKSTWCTATQSSIRTKHKLDKVVETYKRTIAKAYGVNKDVLDTIDSVFEESDAQW